MQIELKERTAEAVRIYFEKAGLPEIRKMLPQKAQTVEEALEDYRKTLLPGASSYGRTIYVDGTYVGDIWCYGINSEETPNAMLSYCIFDQSYWSKGIATAAVAMFVQEICRRYSIHTIGAFTFAQNVASIRVLMKNGFDVIETFEEERIGLFAMGGMKRSCHFVEDMIIRTEDVRKRFCLKWNYSERKTVEQTN